MTPTEAYEVARAYLGKTGWSLRPTSEGWLIEFDQGTQPRQTVLFVEASTGALVLFPSSVSPADIAAHYDAVRHLGSEMSV